MAKKRRIVRKSARRASRVSARATAVRPIKNRISLAWKNLLLFLVLFVISYILYNSSTDSLLVNLFGILLIILGFLAFAFLIILVILVILKSEKNN